MRDFLSATRCGSKEKPRALLICVSYLEVGGAAMYSAHGLVRPLYGAGVSATGAARAGHAPPRRVHIPRIWTAGGREENTPTIALLLVSAPPPHLDSHLDTEGDRP